MLYLTKKLAASAIIAVFDGKSCYIQKERFQKRGGRSLDFAKLRVCLVHDWLVTYRGGEKVLETLCELFPQAPIFTLFYDPRKMPPGITGHQIYTPKFSRLLAPTRKILLPLLPKMIESFNLDSYDLIVSSSSCVAKGAIKRPGAKHICYIHSPMRYVWDQMEEYIQGVKSLPGAEKMIRAYAPKMRSWDVGSAQGVDQFVANSSFVQDRVQRYYNRRASVIHPPVNIDWYQKASLETPKGGYLLAAGAMVSYKRFDLAIDACERLGKRLILAGSGPMLPQLKKMAGNHCQFIIQPDDLTFAKLLAGAEALIFPGVEDFGMIAIEAMAAGTPVIALKKGGALDFIKVHETGLFFPEPTVQDLVHCIDRFKAQDFKREILWNWVLGFGKSSFLLKMKSEIDSLFV